MSTLRRQVGTMVRHHRERAGLTQGELAEKTGNALETISRIERGKSAPSFTTIEKFTKALDIDARDLFGAGEYASQAGRNDPLVRMIERLSTLFAADLEWAKNYWGWHSQGKQAADSCDHAHRYPRQLAQDKSLGLPIRRP